MGERIQRVTVAALAALAVSCQFSENRHLDRRVDRAEVVGQWVGTPFAMDSLKYAGYKTHLNATDHWIDLRPDGSCKAETVLDPANPSPNGSGTWITAKVPCRWQFGSRGDHQTIDMSLSMSSEGVRQIYFYFDEEAAALLLWQYAGDPDAWKYMEFSKSAEAG